MPYTANTFLLGDNFAEIREADDKSIFMAWSAYALFAYKPKEENRHVALNLGEYGYQQVSGADPIKLTYGQESVALVDYVSEIEEEVLPPEALTAGVDDDLAIVLDALSWALQPHKTASLADILAGVFDELYPPPIEALHLEGLAGDLLYPIMDEIGTLIKRSHVGALADSLPPIQELISAALINMETAARWVAPVTITPKVETIDPLYLAAHAIRHPERYFEPRVKSYGSFTRAISAPVGFIRSGDVTISIVDSDNSVRQRIAAKTIRKALAEVRLGPEGGNYFAFLRPLMREVGVVGQPSDGELSIPLRDFLADLLDKKATPVSFSGANFADAILSVLVSMRIPESLDKINYASFDEVRVKVADLECTGSTDEETKISWGELLTRLQRSSNIDIFCDKNDRITVAYTADDDEPVVHLDDLLRLHGGSVRQSLAEPVANQIPYVYNTDVEATYDNTEDQEALGGEIIESESVTLHFVADEATALAVIERRAQYLSLESFRFEGEIPLIPVVEELELGQLVSIEHFGGIKSGGYVAEQFKITELAMDLDNLKYRFKGIRRKLPPPDFVETYPNDTGRGGDAGATRTGIDGVININARCGPFVNDVDGELFGVFMSDSNPKKLVMWRTDNYGVTWGKTDESNEPSLAGNVASFDCCRSGNLLHCAVQESGGRVSHHTFNMDTRLWEIVNAQVVASASNGGSNCVSIECRNAGGEPVVYFQGDRELVLGSLYGRGYFSIKQGGSWSAPAMVTPDPGQYPENLSGWSAAHADSSNCNIQRVVPGRENRMHFFYEVNPAVHWVQWSPDEYGVTMQENLSIGSKQLFAGTSVYYPAYRNIGGFAVYDNHERMILARKSGYGGWGQAFVDRYLDDVSLSHVGEKNTDGTIYNSSMAAENPAGFVGVDETENPPRLYLVTACWGPRYITVQESVDHGATWTDQVKAGPSVPYPNDIQTLCGNIVRVRGHVYVTYFAGPSFPTFVWIKVDSLPYTEA